MSGAKIDTNTASVAIDEDTASVAVAATNTGQQAAANQPTTNETDEESA